MQFQKGTADRTAGHNRRAFTLIEVMLSLSVMAFVMNLTFPVIICMRNLRDNNRTYYQDEIGVYQLQLELAVNEIQQVNRHDLRYRTIDNDCILHIVNDKLISQPGTLDFIHDVSQVEFYVDEQIVYLEYEKDGISFRWPIAYVQE